MVTRSCLAAALLTALAACGGGGSDSTTVTPGGPGSGPKLGPPSKALVRVSGNSPYASGCGGESAQSVSYEDAEVEPYMAVNPANPSNIIGAWQQDRFSDGGAHGLAVGASMDGGKTWKESTLAMSVCGGGDSGNGGNYARASDPWVTISPDGTAYVISISFTGDTFQAGSVGGVLVSRSTDGGLHWSDPVTLIRDGAAAFNDKEAITADPTDSHFVYAVWDRLTVNNHGPAMFARTTDGGASWDPARAIYDPGVNNQTLGNEIVVMPDGTVVDMFVELDGSFTGNNATSTIRVIRSVDHGVTWSAPISVAQSLAVGVADPNDANTVLRTGAGIPQMAAGPGSLLAVVWQDARFTSGKRDSIAFSRSHDGGLTWSAPVAINSQRSVPAFTPSVAVLADGTVGVSYFDFRHDTPGTNLPTDYWFTSSSDGVHWSEQHISGPFDMMLAPDAEGLFVGDYQSLGTVGSVFVPFYVQTNDAGSGNRNDAYYLPPQPHPLSVTRHVSRVALAEATPEPDAAFRRRVHENLMHLMKDEIPRWDEIRTRAGTQPP
jgi:hypothetical protein